MEPPLVYVVVVVFFLRLIGCREGMAGHSNYGTCYPGPEEKLDIIMPSVRYNLRAYLFALDYLGIEYIGL